VRRRLVGLAGMGRVLGQFRPRAGGYESWSRLTMWLPISASIGLVAGGGAILFTKAIELVTHLALEGVTGMRPPGPVG